jgi:peroxiredoxin/outer membrane lipoprotein-sorting protein
VEGRQAIVGLRGMKMTPSMRVAFWFVCAALVAMPVRAEMSVSEILKRTGENYRGLRNYHIVAEWESTVSLPGAMPSTQSFDLAAAEGGKVHLIYKQGDAELEIVSNGETTWTWSPKLKKYTKQEVAVASSLSDDSESDGEEDPGALAQAQRMLIGRFMGLERYGEKAELVKAERVKMRGAKVDCYRVKIDVKQSVYELWIDQQQFLVIRAVQAGQMKTGQGSVVARQAISCKELTVGSAPDPDQFKFTPPANATEVQALGLPGEHVSLVGRSAAGFTLKTVGGDAVSLSDLRGKVVLLDFWATWCSACRKELPTIDKLSRQYEGKDVAVFGVSDEDGGTQKGFLKKNNYNLPCLVDASSAVHKLYATWAIPTVIVIDKRGTIVAHLVGGGSEEKLMAVLKSAGAEAQAQVH